MSVDSLHTSYEFIIDCLRKQLIEKNIRWELFKAPSPLLICESKQDIVAFTIINEHPAQPYSRAYDQFKKLYSDRHRLWSTRNLSFVLCRTDVRPSDDSFYNEIEYDVFFCKKYVIYLKLDRARFLEEIQRLPFLPLKPESVEALRRPISAQTLLQNCGVDSKLSSHLVKAKEKKGAKIAEVYLTERYLFKPFVSPAVAFQKEKDSMQRKELIRLSSLTINNFRAFKNQDFDLSGDIIILYGPNGLGKTSFFDALDFACTGRIGRLSGKIDKIAPHLDSIPNESCVTVEIENQDRSEYIERNVNDYNYALVDKKKTGRKELLFHLTGLVWEDTARRVENLEKLFRATHLFGQEYQELLIDYKKDSELSEEIVARMLAFEDYIIASNKTTQVMSSFKKRYAELSKSCVEFEAQLKSSQNYRQKLAKTVKSVGSQDSLKALIQKIKNNTEKALRIELPDISNTDQHGIRNWRAKINGELELIQGQSETIANLELRFDQFIKNKKDLVDRKNNSKMYTDRVDKEKLEIEALQKNYDFQSKAIQKLVQEKSSISKEYDQFSWQINTIKKNNELLTKRASLIIRSKILPTADDLSSEDLELLESEMIWIKENLSHWKNRIQQIKNLRGDLKSYQKKRKNMELELDNCKSKYEEKQNEAKKLETKINKTREGDSKLLRMLADIEEFVESSECPVCGANYDTKDDLLQRIIEQKGKRSTESDASIKKQIKSMKEINVLKERISTLESNYASAKEVELKTYDALTLSMKTAREFKDRANRLDFKINDNTIRAINNNLQQTHDLKEYLAINQKLKSISLEANSKKLSLSVDLYEFERKLDEIIKRMAGNQECINKHEKISSNDNEQLKLANDHLRSLKERQDTIRLDIDRFSKNISEYEYDLVKIGLDTESDINMIKSIKENQQERIKSTAASIDDIIRLETAIDSVQSSARLAELDSEIKNIKKNIKKQKSEQLKIDEAIDYFDKIKVALTNQKNISVSEYARNFGPLASIVQRRLRPVYGFGPVELKSKSGKIYVQVSRKSQDLRPIDYFSDSQNQILMLSLFMAAGITQTWSSFAPVLIDDPITHFDDLNAYAFVELLRGIFDNVDRQRQFIISTCDDSLWELFKQRFSEFNGRAIMYKFVAIGEDGPVVKRIN